MMQFTEKGKWTAWDSQKGKSKETAAKEYVEALFAVSYHFLSLLQRCAGV